MLDGELWAERRREHFVRGASIKKLARRTGLSRNTIRRALRSDEPPAYRRAPAGSIFDSFKDEIHRLLKDDPTLSGVRIREELEPLGFAGGKTMVDDYLSAWCWSPAAVSVRGPQPSGCLNASVRASAVCPAEPADHTLQFISATAGPGYTDHPTGTGSLSHSRPGRRGCALRLTR